MNPNGNTSGAQAVAGRLAGMGYRLQLPRPLLAPPGSDVLFVSPSARDWQAWTTEDMPRHEGGAVALQWSIRTTFLENSFSYTAPSAERVVSAAWRGRRPYPELLGDLRAALEATGLRWAEIKFVVSATGDSHWVRDALAASGVTADRLTYGPSPASMPSWMASTGIFLALWASVGDPCSARCDNVCSCGHRMYLAYCQFAKVIRSRDGQYVPSAQPAFQVLIREHALTSALANTPDPFEVPAIQPLRKAATDLISERPWSSDERPGVAARRVSVLADHSFTGALLLGAGVRPAARGSSYVLRRLLRKAATEFALAHIPVSRLIPLVAAADEVRQVPFGFPPLSADARAAVDREVAALSSVLISGRRRFLQRVPALDRSHDIAREIVRLKAERGVPLALLLMWCKNEGVEVSLRHIAAADLPHQPLDDGRRHPHGFPSRSALGWR